MFCEWAVPSVWRHLGVQEAWQPLWHLGSGTSKLNLHQRDTSLHFMHTQKLNRNCLTELIQKQMAREHLSLCAETLRRRHLRWSSRWAQLSALRSLPVQSITLLGISSNYWESYPDFGERSKLQSTVSFASNIFTEIWCLKCWQQSWGYSHQ